MEGYIWRLVCLFLAFDFLALGLAFDFLEFDFLPPTMELGPFVLGAAAVATRAAAVASGPEALVCVGALTFIPCNGKVLVLVTFDLVGNTGLFTGFPPNHDGNIDDKKLILF